MVTETILLLHILLVVLLYSQFNTMAYFEWSDALIWQNGRTVHNHNGVTI